MIVRVLQADHPASRGHFPGNPIIPGAVLLEETLRAIEAELDIRLESFHIRSVKFLHPTRPGDRIVIGCRRGVQGEIDFSCEVEGRAVLKGQLSCHARSKAE